MRQPVPHTVVVRFRAAVAQKDATVVIPHGYGWARAIEPGIG